MTFVFIRGDQIDKRIKFFISWNIPMTNQSTGKIEVPKCWNKYFCRYFCSIKYSHNKTQ